MGTFLTVIPGTLDTLIAKLGTAQGRLPGLLTDAASAFALVGQDAIKAVTPVGQGEDSAPPAGDSSGHLADSYMPVGPSSGAGRVTMALVTTQPTKYGWVVNGTGIYGPAGNRIVPLQARALYWPSAAHPVRSVAGMPPRPYVDQAIPAIMGELAGWAQTTGLSIQEALGL